MAQLSQSNANMNPLIRPAVFVGLFSSVSDFFNSSFTGKVIFKILALPSSSKTNLHCITHFRFTSNFVGSYQREMAPVLAHWDIRCRIEPMRLLLVYASEDFEDKRYSFDDRNAWFSVKPTLGLDFPNLPYYIDGDVKITQSIAIMRYLARKHHLTGETTEEKTRIDIIEQQLNDFVSSLISTVLAEDFETAKQNYLKTLPDQLKQYSDFLGNHKWFAGDNISYVDFFAYEAFDYHRLLSPDCLDDLPNLQDFMRRFESLASIRAYMESDKFKKWPVFAPFAKWGGTKQPV